MVVRQLEINTKLEFKEILEQDDVIIDQNVRNAKIGYSEVNIEEINEHTYEYDEV